MDFHCERFKICTWIRRFCFMLSCGIYTSCMNCALVSKKQIQQLTFKIFFLKHYTSKKSKMASASEVIAVPQEESIDAGDVHIGVLTPTETNDKAKSKEFVSMATEFQSDKFGTLLYTLKVRIHDPLHKNNCNSGGYMSILS